MRSAIEKEASKRAHKGQKKRGTRAPRNRIYPKLEEGSADADINKKPERGRKGQRSHGSFRSEAAPDTLPRLQQAALFLPLDEGHKAENVVNCRRIKEKAS